MGDHKDNGSLLTVIVMLKQPAKGGELQTVTAAGQLVTHELALGDALVFVSHKCHRVTQVLKGERRTLVIELWDGIERTCGHRCEKSVGKCDFVMRIASRCIKAR